MDLSKLSIIDKICHSTVRIEAVKANGTASSGSSFIMSFANKTETSQHVPALVTNKHVVEGADKLRFAMTVETPAGKTSIEWFEVFVTDITILNHPTEDLCAIPIAVFHHLEKAKGLELVYVQLEMSLIPSDENLNKLTAMEDIVMVGYPDGLWDKHNNMPLIRKGVTSTHPKLDYNGNSEFVIDCACFNGSSGSPVFLFNNGSYNDKDDNAILGNRLYLLGVLHAGHLHYGQLEKLAKIPGILTAMPNNLGLVIKSKALLYFDQVLSSPHA